MTATATDKSKSDSSADNGKPASAAKSELQSEQGTTSIADIVVQKVAGLAARNVRGVHDLGGGAARAFGAIRDRIPGASASVGQGVSVEVGRPRPRSIWRSSSNTASPSPNWRGRSGAV